MEPKVYFVGAGPGDPELITLKGRKLLDSAGVIVWAGSLVNPALLENVSAKLYDSAGMNLDEIIKVMADAVRAGVPVVRLHTGDISFYSAISEQIERLRELDIPFEVVPGVSSVGAAAAALGQELTIPEVSQTVIHTRMSGRTPVPEAESIRSLASHKATLAIFLSVSMMEKLAAELLAGGYDAHTPVAVVERASWPGQRIVRGTVGDIAVKVREAGIKKTALIFVGESLRATLDSTGENTGENTGRESKLYNKDFRHGYRK